MARQHLRSEGADERASAVPRRRPALQLHIDDSPVKAALRAYLTRRAVVTVIALRRNRMRLRLFLLAAVSCLGAVPYAFADPIEISRGTVALASPFSGLDPPFGFELFGNDTVITEELESERSEEHTSELQSRNDISY